MGHFCSITRPQNGSLYVIEITLTPPDPLRSETACLPSRSLQHRRDLLVPVTPLLTRQPDRRRCQPILVGSPPRFISLRSSGLPQQPAGVPLAHPVSHFGSPHHTTPPLGA